MKASDKDGRGAPAAEEAKKGNKSGKTHEIVKVYMDHGRGSRVESRVASQISTYQATVRRGREGQVLITFPSPSGGAELELSPGMAQDLRVQLGATLGA